MDETVKTGYESDEQTQPELPVKLTHTEAITRAHGIVLQQLTLAPKTRAQLRTVLRRRGVTDEVAEIVLGRFAQAKLIDDELFATMWVESRHAGKGLSRQALERELRTRGIDPDMAKEAASAVDDESELAAATELVCRRAASMKGLDPQRRDRRLLGFLARRGYNHEVSRRALRAALDTESSLDDCAGSK